MHCHLSCPFPPGTCLLFAGPYMRHRQTLSQGNTPTLVFHSPLFLNLESVPCSVSAVTTGLARHGLNCVSEHFCFKPMYWYCLSLCSRDFFMILSHRQSLGRHTTSELKGRMTETIAQIYPFSIYFSGVTKQVLSISPSHLSLISSLALQSRYKYLIMGNNQWHLFDNQILGQCSSITNIVFTDWQKFSEFSDTFLGGFGSLFCRSST